VSGRRKPRVLTRCVANTHTGDNERIIEFSFPGLRDTGGGPAGGLISFRQHDDTARVEVYRVDGPITVVPPADKEPDLYTRLTEAATDDEAAMIEAIAVKAGILARCKRPACAGWVTRLPAEKCERCGSAL
jgi:hypothetical protein